RTAALLRACGARAVLAGGSGGSPVDAAVAAAAPELGRLEGPLGEALGSPPDGRIAGTAEASAPAPTPASHRPEPGDLALVQFSSGTTANPKPVALTHRAILAQVAILNGFWPEEDGVEHRGVSWLPLHHDMGLIGCLFPALERAGDLALLPPELFVARPAAWLRAISRHRATISPAPNFAYGLCAERIRDRELDGVDLSSWRLALNGAEPVAAGTLRAFARRFHRWGFRPEALTPVYGLAEAALAVTFSAIDRPFRSGRFERDSLAPGRAPRAASGSGGRELVSLGRPVPGFRVEVRPPASGPPGAGAPARAGAVGRVWIGGPSLMEGYLDRPAETARTLRDGWLDTGDLGFLRDGELYLTGRAKDLVILRGRNYGPEEIEAAAARADGARAAVAVSRLPEDGHREELILLVEAARGAGPEEARALPAALRKRVTEAVDLPPDRVVLLAPGSLPRTSSGKLRRGEALRRWEAGELPEAAGPDGGAGERAGALEDEEKAGTGTGR
ncbi:MAG: AMP-binding protein, partial [Thermoanaerobaculia bacterium]